MSVQDTGQATPSEAPATTAYVVMVVHERLTAEEANGTAPELWREAGVLSVPQRTQRSTVLQSAGEMAAAFMPEGGAPARFRVWPLDAQQDGEVALERPDPQMVVTSL